MSAAFARVDGAPRVRVDESDWASLVAASHVPLSGLGALSPLEAPAPGSADPTAVEATALALGRALVHLDVTSASGDRGLVTSLGSDGRTAAIATRALVVPDGGGAETQVAPGIELTVVGPDRLLAEIMRLVPPDVPFDAAEPDPPIVLPQTDALVLSEAVRSGDDAVARQIARDQGWDEVPAVLEALASQVRANVTVALRIEGHDAVVVRRWLQSDLGWVGLAVDRTDAVHTPCTRAGMAQELLHSLTGAFETALTGAGLDG